MYEHVHVCIHVCVYMVYTCVTGYSFLIMNKKSVVGLRVGGHVHTCPSRVKAECVFVFLILYPRFHLSNW